VDDKIRVAAKKLSRYKAVVKFHCRLRGTDTVASAAESIRESHQRCDVLPESVIVHPEEHIHNSALGRRMQIGSSIERETKTYAKERNI